MVSIHKQNEPTFGSTSNVFPATKTAKIHKRMSDCCYSISNLALIVSRVVVIVVIAVATSMPTLICSLTLMPDCRFRP